MSAEMYIPNNSANRQRNTEILAAASDTIGASTISSLLEAMGVAERNAQGITADLAQVTVHCIDRSGTGVVEHYDVTRVIDYDS